MTRPLLAVAGFCVLAFVVQSGAQTTTFTAETSNNTSTSTTFAGMDNPRGSGAYFNIPGKNPPANSFSPNISRAATRTLLYNGSTTNIYGHFMGWFGDT